MPPRSLRRLSPDEIEADRKMLLALKNITDYAPANPAYSTEAMAALGEALELAEQAQLRAEKNLETARAQTLAAASELHEALRGVKAQVMAQFGDDSFEIQSLGLKRRSEHKRPVRREGPAAQPELTR